MSTATAPVLLATTHPGALAALRNRAAALLRQQLAPPPKLTVSEWADRHRYLSREASAEPGKWSTERTPYLRAVMDAFNDPLVEEVVCEFGTQLGKTEVLNNVAGYYVDQDPAPLLVVQPSLDTARAWSLDRLAPMLRDTPRLKGKVHDAKTRDSGNTILHKTFPGGHITIVGANSAAGLSMRPIRIVMCDEIDRYPPSAGTEGDPVNLATSRAATFWNRKIGKFSSPTLENASRIDEAYRGSSRGRYVVPCAHCGLLQVLRWAQLKWEEGKPETAMYLCGVYEERERDPLGKRLEGCGALIDEAHKHRMLQGGAWRYEDPAQRRVMGFHLNTLYSPWMRWGELASLFVRAVASADDEVLKVFINTKLAETWTERGQRLDPEGLGIRREQYPQEVPAGVGILTGGVDVHPDRLELLVRGWGVGEESWGIRQLRLYGDPTQADVWERLEVELTRPYPHTWGGSLRIRAVAIDSGDETDAVYRFVRPRQGRGVWATKGMPGQHGRPLVTKPSKPKPGIRLWPLGVDAGKDILFRRLKITEAGPGYMHFASSFDDEYFLQFAAEKKVTKRHRGRLISVFVQDARRRNEAIDLEVLALAALHILGPPVRDHLGRWVEKAQKDGAAAGGPEGEPPRDEGPGSALRPRRRPPGGGGWMTSWRR